MLTSRGLADPRRLAPILSQPWATGPVRRRLVPVMRAPMHKVWGDAALTGGLFPLSWTQDGVRHDRLLRIVHVWARREGRWRITYTQLTRVPQ